MRNCCFRFDRRKIGFFAHGYTMRMPCNFYLYHFHANERMNVVRGCGIRFMGWLKIVYFFMCAIPPGKSSYFITLSRHSSLRSQQWKASEISVARAKHELQIYRKFGSFDIFWCRRSNHVPIAFTTVRVDWIQSVYFFVCFVFVFAWFHMLGDSWVFLIFMWVEWISVVLQTRCRQKCDV